MHGETVKLREVCSFKYSVCFLRPATVWPRSICVSVLVNKGTCLSVISYHESLSDSVQSVVHLVLLYHIT